MIGGELRLHDRVVRMDRMIHADAAPPAPAGHNPLNPHMARLRAAFETE